MAEKKYFWLKLERDFFRSKAIKRLRKQAGGDTYTIIVMELQLQAIGSNGLIKLEGIESPEEELALELDEEPENVKVVLNYLFRIGWAEILDENTLFFPCAIERTGSETQAAERMRQMRSRNNVTQVCNAVTPALRECSENVTLEIEKEIEIEIEIEDKPAATAATARPSIDYQSILDDYNRTCTRLPKVTKLSDARRKAIAARLKSYTPEELHKIFQMAQDSDFLCGKNNRDWSASFDWLMKDANAAKVLDRQYENKDILRNGGDQNGKGGYYARIFSDPEHNL